MALIAFILPTPQPPLSLVDVWGARDAATERVPSAEHGSLSACCLPLFALPLTPGGHFLTVVDRITQDAKSRPQNSHLLQNLPPPAHSALI